MYVRGVCLCQKKKDLKLPLSIFDLRRNEAMRNTARTKMAMMTMMTVMRVLLVCGPDGGGASVVGGGGNNTELLP